MVKGLDLFRRRFREFEGSFVLIGGAACDEWFSSLGLSFRATKDLDIVLIIEVVTADALRGLRAFIAEGGYEVRQRTTGAPVLYRFAKPTNAEFPFMLEFFSRKPDGLKLGDGQEITPIPAGSACHSLSAILVDDDYYSLIQTHQMVHDGLSFATATALIPLKACAWLDFNRRKAEGQKIDSKDIAKHRNDVFRLVETLPGEPGSALPVTITDDLARFLRSFPEDSPEWEPILVSLKNTFGGTIRPARLRSAIQTFFRLPEE
jgi:hypothetical protein